MLAEPDLGQNATLPKINTLVETQMCLYKPQLTVLCEQLSQVELLKAGGPIS